MNVPQTAKSVTSTTAGSAGPSSNASARSAAEAGRIYPDGNAGRHVQVRVHGVGGAEPGDILSDTTEPVPVRRLSGDRRTAWYQSESEPRRYAYHWSGLTTSSRWQAIWLLLLPFTMLNVARWTCERSRTQTSRRWNRASDALLGSVAVACTVNWMLWLWFAAFAGMSSHLSLSWPIDHAARAVTTAGCFVTALSITVLLLNDRRLPQRWAMGVGFASLFAIAAYLGLDTATAASVWASAIVAPLALVLIAVARRSNGTPLQSPLAPAAQPGLDTSGPDRTGPDRTGLDESGQGLIGLGVATGRADVEGPSIVAVVHVVAILATALVAFVTTDGPIASGVNPLDTPIIVVGALQFAALFGLLVVDGLRLLRARREHTSATLLPTASTAFMSALVLNGFLAGIALTVVMVSYGSDTGDDPAWHDMDAFALLDVFAGGFVLTIAAFAAWWVISHRRPARHEASVVASLPDDVDPHLKQQTRTSLRTGTFVQHLDLPLAIGTVGLAIGFVTASLSRVSWSSDPPTLNPPEYPEFGLLGVVLVVIAGVSVVLLFALAGFPKWRRLVGQIWDIGGCFERRMHPIGMRPYVERALPELARVQADALSSGHTVSWYAHSQGSVLVYGALRPESGRLVDHGLDGTTAVVTAGSPLRQLYARYFPRLGDPGDLSSINQDWWRDPPPGFPTDGGWWNWLRWTDPIAGPVFSPAGQAARDCILNDPSPDPRTGEWRLQGHNDYHLEPAVISLLDSLE